MSNSPEIAPAKPRVVFVDDEDNILKGIARMLRAKRGVWDMIFAPSGRAALEAMATAPPDLVVSDMRMPGMDGAELLAKVRDRHPKAVRFVLSGFAEREAVLKTIGPSHRYLAKPCDEKTLVNAIETSLKLRILLHGSALEQSVARLSFVPSAPRIYADILSELSSKFGSAESLTAKIEQDVGISAQLLKLTNSAYFSLPTRCATVKQAINFLGFDNVRAAVLMAGVFDQFRNLTPAMIHVVEAVGRHSLGLGILAQAIARSEGQDAEIADQAFCAGILSHIGTVVLAANQSERFQVAMSDVDKHDVPLIEAELGAFGANHGEVGAFLLGLWGFSDPIVEAIAHHHRPGAYTRTSAPVLTALHIAQYLTRAYSSRPARRTHSDDLDASYLEAIGATSRLPEWQKVFETVSGAWPRD